MASVLVEKKLRRRERALLLAQVNHGPEVAEC